MTWAVWLGVPAVATALAAVWTWLRSRPARTPSTADAMKAHSDYLDALSADARGRRRVEQITADPSQRR